MSVVKFRFYEELNDFLPQHLRKREFDISFRPNNSIKDMIESIGVPHTEIDLILVNGQSVKFSYIVQPEDQISVYPVFEALDISNVTHLRPEPLRRIRFVLDTHLGKLARYLRLLGFDTLYNNDWIDEELVKLSASGDKRILLTRDHGLLKRKQLTHGYFIRNDQPKLQIKEVLLRFNLHRKVQPFTRCMRCNGLINSVAKDQVIKQLPIGVINSISEFSACEKCQRVYWKGSHYDHMQRIIEELLKE